MNTIEVVEIPLIELDKKNLRDLLNTPGYATLRSILTAHCVKASAEWLNANLYSTEAAQDVSKRQQAQAQKFNQVLDTLDWLAKNEEQWFQAQLEPRR